MKVSIIGYGWLGKALFNEFRDQKIDTTVYSRNSTNEGQVISYILGDNIPHSLLNSDVIFILIPPRLRSSDTNNVIENHNNFFIQIPPDIKIIYTSSTSVYSDTKLCSEESSCNGPLFEIEKLIRSRFKNSLILRLAGLAGPNRTIVNILQKKGIIDNWNNPTNLVHQKDVISCLKIGLEQKITGTYNICSDKHPNKFNTYNDWNVKNNLPLLIKGESSISHKIIVNKLWKEHTHFLYEYSDPLTFTF